MKRETREDKTCSTSWLGFPRRGRGRYGRHGEKQTWSVVLQFRFVWAQVRYPESGTRVGHGDSDTGVTKSRW